MRALVATELGTVPELRDVPEPVRRPGEALVAPLAVSINPIAERAGWRPLARRASVQPGERVLALGATGTLGHVAVQAAPLLGASQVVAAGRPATGLVRAKAAGADAVVRLDEPGDLTERLRYTNLRVPVGVLADGYRTLVEHARDGRLAIDFEPVPLDHAVEGWTRQASGGAGVKLAVTFDGE